MPYRIDPNTGQPVWDGTSIPQASRDSLATQIRELQAQIDALSFIDLDDVPTTYTGQSGKILAVKATEDGLEFIADGGGGGGVSDGDKGDITVTGSGTVWTIDSGAITTAKIADGQVTVAKTSGFGSIATQASSSVTITGGSITGITDLAIADGGTGASTAENARTNLGLGGAAVLAVGTTTGTVAAGDDARFHSAAFVANSLQSVMYFSGQNLEAIATPVADRIVFFDQSIGSWEYLALGTGLSISGQTINASIGTNTILQFFPRDAEFPATGFATIDTRNNHPCLDFDDNTVETVFFTGFIPQGATFATSGTALTFVLLSTAQTALTGNIGWLVALERIVANGIDIDGDDFGTAQPGSAAVIGGANTGKVTEVSITFTLAQLPSLLAAGDMIRVRVQRNTSVSGDHAGDAELLGVYANMTP